VEMWIVFAQEKRGDKRFQSRLLSPALVRSRLREAGRRCICAPQTKRGYNVATSPEVGLGRHCVQERSMQGVEEGRSEKAGRKEECE
jgi:hypothetical protein